MCHHVGSSSPMLFSATAEYDRSSQSSEHGRSRSTLPRPPAEAGSRDKSCSARRVGRSKLRLPRREITPDQASHRSERTCESTRPPDSSCSHCNESSRRSRLTIIWPLPKQRPGDRQQRIRQRASIIRASTKSGASPPSLATLVLPESSTSVAMARGRCSATPPMGFGAFRRNQYR